MRWSPSLLAALLCLAGPSAAVTLEQAMADPDWIGPPVERPYWSVDGTSVYYQLKREGSGIRDLRRVTLADGADGVVDPPAMAATDGPDPVFDATRTRAAFIRNGDLFVRETASGRLLQATRSAERETAPQFSADGRQVQFRVDNDWFAFDIATGVVAPAVILKTGKDPAAKKPDDLGELQLRLFSTLRKVKDDREARRQHAEAFQAGDPTRAPLPVFLGEEADIVSSALAPDGRWLLVGTRAKGYEAGRVAKMQTWVTESGYEEGEDERVRVGRNAPAPQTLWLVDLAARSTRKLAYGDLPGITDDPLKAVREENAKDAAAAAGEGDTSQAGKKDKTKAKDKAADKPAERALELTGYAWSRDGRHAAVQLRSIDNKDRWIATVDFAAGALVAQHRLTDPAWINWNFNEFGWADDARTLWYLSEETGYSQLYVKTPGGKAKALTDGRFEVSSPRLSPDGRFYVRANVEAPYAYDVYRVAIGGGPLERVSRYGGLDDFTLSPDGSRLAVLHSSAYVPQQLAVLAADGSGAPRELTDTRKPDYRALRFAPVEIVGVPSSKSGRPIWSKLYKPADFDPTKRYPAVLFVHGAGYLQNTHQGYPNYFREQLFHNLLVERGYVVLDMDYRASEGYGRDWRTAIYRQMGHPELEDLVDGARWLAAEQAVDPQRVGLYGGSYGGFMALMAMFRAPEVFHAGAALRPVTDWTSYNHGYTSNILNTPQVDPLAYRRSSPIEFADGLRGPLLIAHGMIDDNVLFQDSVRLYQRLIELRKDDFELAGYPMERHGFVHADAWFDEYKRILKLFETHLRR
ncbi:S9 family peptidase [Dokdonella koreensis]|uniref:Dipeptidyl peptidase IV n=1 Tax=Dokdonella koreensis DS-123 TaxID=1300342 RepID=A0A167GJQ3_9GAMM|nr:S9 family peptidase [Dokdonella koreensis]ANB16637.1 Dipeptidyl peptidase IV [Dokdonella koreensis DS-123]